MVFVPGWAQVMNDWYALPQELSQIGRTALAFDCRGLGESAQHPGTITVEDIAADVVELAKALLPPGPFVVLGHSAGVFVAQYMAVAMPSLVAAAVFSCGQGARKDAVGGDAKFFKLGRGTWSQNEALEASSRDPKKLADRMTLIEYCIDAVDLDPTGRTFRQICQDSLAECRPQIAINAQLKMLGSADFGDKLSSIKCPVLVVHGDQDTVIPVKNADTLFNSLANSRLRRLKIMPGLRHFPFAPSTENARFVAVAISEFLAESESSRNAIASKL